MDHQRLEAIKQRAAQATEGPWVKGSYRGVGEDYDIETANGGTLDGVMRGMFGREADADFVAHAREDVPALIEALEEALEEAYRMDSEENGGSTGGIAPHPGRNQIRGV